jgi:hypothetical protein
MLYRSWCRKITISEIFTGVLCTVGGTLVCRMSWGWYRQNATKTWDFLSLVQNAPKTGYTHSALGVFRTYVIETNKLFIFIILLPLCVKNISQSLDFTELNDYLGYVLLWTPCFVRIALPINVVHSEHWLSAHTNLVNFIGQNALGVFWTGERNTPLVVMENVRVAWLIDWLFTVLRPPQEYFTYMETSPLLVKGCKI